jgi:hypothetical protein
MSLVENTKDVTVVPAMDDQLEEIVIVMIIEDEKFYCIFCVQKRSRKVMIRENKSKHSDKNLSVLCEIECKPNSKNVWHRFKDYVKIHHLADQIKNGKTKIGIVFNTDPHYKGGSHWISLFINIKKGTIFFFDSAGDKIPKQIMKLVEKITEQGKQLHPPINFHFDQNHPVEHQFGNTECGMYSLFFIIFMLQDKITGGHLKKKIYKDKFIEQYRKIFFNEDL